MADHHQTEGHGKTVERHPGVVLLVEDNDDLRETLTETLEYNGYEVVARRDGASALTSFEKAPRQFVCSVLDLRLPDIDGREILDRMRQVNSDACIVLMSGMALPDRFRKTRRLRPNAVLQKPFGEEEFLAKIQEAVHGNPDPDAAAT